MRGPPGLEQELVADVARLVVEAEAQGDARAREPGEVQGVDPAPGQVVLRLVEIEVPDEAGLDVEEHAVARVYVRAEPDDVDPAAHLERRPVAAGLVELRVGLDRRDPEARPARVGDVGRVDPLGRVPVDAPAVRAGARRHQRGPGEGAADQQWEPLKRGAHASPTRAGRNPGRLGDPVHP